jgi:hypothetical protein
MKIDFLQEPELEFGAGRHIDIRFGLMNYSPLDFVTGVAPKHIRVGIVGTPETVEGVEEWFDRCKREIAAKTSRQPNLFPKFSGFNLDKCFRSNLIMEPRLKRTISQRDFDKLAKLKQDDVINESIQMFLSEFRYLVQNANPDVLVCAAPISIAKLMVLNEAGDERGDEPDRYGDKVGPVRVDFHDLLKAKAMVLRKPIQIILPPTYDETKRLHQKRRDAGIRRLQDEATRAWNIHTALYYKAGGMPWRLVRDPSGLTTCYVGVSFYRSLNTARVLTSMAEVFNERGYGMIVRGASPSLLTEDRQPHLSESDAYNLLGFALDLYREEHHTLPARVVVHKTSRFDHMELRGFSKAVEARGIDSADFITINKALTRLFRFGAYPPLRGTLMELDDKNYILYTRGSVDFFATYPGMYVPRPLGLHFDQIEQTAKFVAREILTLTKMNWNNTQFDNAFPITIEAARRVGEILRYVSETEPIEPRYSYYM